MTIDSPLLQMQQLEALLLHTDFRTAPQQLEQLLAEDFQEVSPAGNINTREEVIRWLLQKDPVHRWQFSEWQLSELAPTVRLLRYHALQCIPASRSKGALHCSLWCLDQARHCWRLHFHQSTKTV